MSCLKLRRKNIIKEENCTTEKITRKPWRDLKDPALTVTIGGMRIYDGINLFNDVLNLMDTERDNDFFAEVKKARLIRHQIF